MEPERTASPSLAERMLVEAHAFVLDGWCRGASAVDEMGRPIEPSSAFARRWSALGALERAWRRAPEPPDEALEAFERARLALAFVVKEPPESWNDRAGRSAGDVLAALEAALEAMAAGRHESLDHIGPRYGAGEDAGVSLPAESPREP